jgi:lipooligosaccharide transport system permease protein
MVEMLTLPMFLFSTTFYPISAYPHAARLVLAATPLYNGVALLRALSLGAVNLATVGHVVYLAVLGMVGVSIAARRLDRRLLR